MNQSSDNWETRLGELVGALRDESLSEEQSVTAVVCEPTFLRKRKVSRWFRRMLS